MANIKLTELNPITALDGSDVLVAVDVSADETHKITATNLYRTLPDGTAAAPALAFSSDQANGVYLAGTDTVGISTGGTQRVTVDGSGNVTISGNLQVDGATTTVQSTTVTIDDKNLELGSVATPTNTTADGGGITLKGATDKTLKWIESTGCWTFNQPMNFNDHVRIDSSGRVGIGTSTLTGNSGSLSILMESSLYWRKANGQIKGDILVDNSENIIFNQGASSTEVARIDSSGRLFIGTSSSVVGSTDNKLQVLSAGGARIALGRDDTSVSSGNTIGDIQFYANDQGSQDRIGSIRCAASSAHTSTSKPTNLLFETTSSSSVTPSERLRIDSAGNVGIGITSPAAKLAIHTTTTTNSSSQLLRITSANGALFGIETDETVSNPTWKIGGIVSGGTAEPLAFYQVGSEVARIDSSGRLGVGTTSPGSKLELSGSGNACELRLRSTDTTNAIIRSYVNSLEAGKIAFTSGRELFIETAGSERLRIDSSGRLLVGTTTEGHADADNLTIADSGNCGLTIRSGTSNAGSIYFSDATSGAAEYDGYIAYNQNSRYLRFGTAQTERLRIDSSGNVGIGITSPGRNLVVNSGASSGYIQLVNTNSGTTASNGFELKLDSAGAIVDLINRENGAMRFFTNNTVRMRINSSGDLCFGSSVGANNDGSGISIYNASNPRLSFRNSTTGNTTSDGSQLYLVNSDLYVTNNESANLIFRTNSTERVRIDSSGRVGIGISSPSRVLHIKASGANTPQIALIDNDSSNAIWQVGNQSDGDGFMQLLTDDGTSAVLFDASGTNYINGGDLGIGTTSPGSKVHVFDSNPEVRLQSSGTSTTCEYSMLGRDGSNVAHKVNIKTSDSALTFGTGGSSGNSYVPSERMRIDSSGRLLLGTTTEGNSAADDLTIAGSGHTGITIRSGTSSEGALYFSDGTSGNAEYRGYLLYNHNDEGLRFATAAVERFRITSTGAWSIEGASNYGTSGQVLTSNGNDAPTWQTPSSGTQIIQGNTNVECVDTGSNGHILFDTEGSERMRINSSGKVQVGTTTDVIWNQTSEDGVVIEQSGATQIVRNGDIPLLVTRNTSTGQIAKFSQAGTERGSILYDGDFGISSASDLTFDTNGSERMRIDSSGSVGIGNTAMSSYNGASNDLVVGNHTGAHGLTIASQSNNSGYIMFADGTSGQQQYEGQIEYNHGSNYMRFNTAGNERMRVDSSGRVLIGTTTEGTASADDLTIATTGSTGITVRSGTSSNGNLFFSDATSGTAEHAGYVQYSHANNELRFGTNTNERLRITSGGDVRVKDFAPRIGAAISSVSGNFSSYFGASGTTNANLPMIVERYNDNGVSIEFKRSQNVVGNVNVTASSTNYATSSDHRLKENVVDLDGAITRVKQLAPKRFNFIVDADTTVDGFLAHEAATVVPEAVTGTYNEVDDENNPVYQGIDQSKLVPLLTAALQEAIAKIETLEAKVAALEAS